jgi:polar amino acid transport system ATP-binding protein
MTVQPNAEPILELVDIHKQFGELEVLRGVDLTVKAGEAIAIVGVSGSGKSTLLRCVNLLEEPTSGAITFAKQPVVFGTEQSWLKRNKMLAALRAEIGMVFQQFNLWPHMTVLGNVIEAPMVVKGIARREAVATAEELLESIGLLDKRDEYPSRLSGGQQQRVAIVRALAMRPKLMLFDEVTSSLDPELVGEVLDLMARLVADGMTMLLVTHEIDFAREVSDRTIFIDQGLIEEQGRSREILANPQTERMQRFLERVLHRVWVE